MSLQDALHDVARTYEVPPPPPGLYDRAKRAQLHRRLLAGAAALVAVASVALPLLLPPAPAQPAAPGARVRLPNHVVAPPRWTADVRHAPLDRAVVAFTLSNPDGAAGTRLTLVGTEDRYRTYDVKPFWLLSPDGRYLMSGDDTRTDVLRLSDGERRTVALGRPLAWSPDGAQAVFAHFAGDPDGSEVATQLRVVSMPDAKVLWDATLPHSQRPGLFLTAALAPDNSALAVQLSDYLYRFAPNGLTWKNSIGTLQELAGPLSWNPDMGAIALTRPGNRADLALVDAATGEALPDLNGSGYLGYVGSQGNLRQLPVIVAWHDNVPQVNAGNKAIVTLPHDVVMTTAENTYEVQVAADGLDWYIEEPGPPNGGPALQRYRPLITAGGGVILLALALGLVLQATLKRAGARRHRARSRR